MRAIVMAVFLLLGISASAAETTARQSEDESVVRTKARKRQYPGGADVEPLKVQSQLPILKVKSEVESEEPPLPSDDAD